MKKMKVLFVYDSSYLMYEANKKFTNYELGQLKMKRPDPDNIFDALISLGDDEYLTVPLMERSDIIDIERVIPKQVEEEIQNHFKNEEKKIKASIARKNIVSLLSQGATVVDLANIDTTTYQQSSALGADSPTDQLLIQYCLKRLSNDISFAFILSNDGGIFYDIINLNKKGNNIFAFDCNHKRIESQENTFETSVQKTFTLPDDYKWSEVYE